MSTKKIICGVLVSSLGASFFAWEPKSQCNGLPCAGNGVQLPYDLPHSETQDYSDSVARMWSGNNNNVQDLMIGTNSHRRTML